jgi:hypothetical protein
MWEIYGPVDLIRTGYGPHEVVCNLCDYRQQSWSILTAQQFAKVHAETHSDKR